MNALIIRKHLSFIIVTTIMVLLTAFFLCGTVVSRSANAQDLSEEVYVNMERDFVADIRYKLDTRGYKNCGINLTRCVDENGFRTYEINLHHKYLSNRDNTSLEALYAELSLGAFLFENCSFTFSLI